MRITKREKNAILSVCAESFGPNSRIWLFGSRVDDSKKGGDIDLYVEVAPQENMVHSKLKFRRLISPVFGEQKIDLITHDITREPTAFHCLAKRTGKLLNEQ